MNFLKKFFNKTKSVDDRTQNQLNEIKNKLEELEITFNNLLIRLETLETAINKIEKNMETKNKMVSLLYYAGVPVKEIAEKLELSIGEAELIIELMQSNNK